MASHTTIRVGSLRVNDIAGNEHVIERTPRLCRDAPQDSLFVSVLLEGEAVFYHRAGCFPVEPGDFVVYETAQPYLFGFSRAMRQFLVDVPRRAVQPAGCIPLSRPVRVPGGSGMARRVRELLLSASATPPERDCAEIAAAVLTSVRATLVGAPSASVRSDASDLLATACRYVDAELRDPSLDASRLARAVGVSVRHLRRVFNSVETTPARYINEQRLLGAHAELTDPTSGVPTIARLASSWGFADHAHFTRSFRERFGQVPSQLRGDK